MLVLSACLWYNDIFMLYICIKYTKCLSTYIEVTLYRLKDYSYIYLSTINKKEAMTFKSTSKAIFKFWTEEREGESDLSEVIML